MERLRKKLSEQESLLLLMSPSMAFRVHSRNGKVSASRGPDIPREISAAWHVRAHVGIPPMVLWASLQLNDSCLGSCSWEVARAPGRE